MIWGISSNLLFGPCFFSNSRFCDRIQIAHNVARVIARIGLRVEDQTGRTRERIGDNAQIGWSAVETPEVLFAVARIREKTFVRALEICGVCVECG